jgi:excisionase family DNA binding protein
MSSEFLTLDEVCKRLGIHRETLRRNVRRGKLKMVHFGYRTKRIREIDLAAFIAKQTH